jgi:hypothetical protein
MPKAIAAAIVLLLGSGSLAHAAVVEPPPSVRQASPELRLLSIWLDPRTREPSLRAQLIGER